MPRFVSLDCSQVGQNHTGLEGLNTEYHLLGSQTQYALCDAPDPWTSGEKELNLECSHVGYFSHSHNKKQPQGGGDYLGYRPKKGWIQTLPLNSPPPSYSVQYPVSQSGAVHI